MNDLNDPASYTYELPAELIAHQPAPERSESRLLVARPDGTSVERVFRELGEFLRRGDLLVFNDTRVEPCRLFAKKPTGGRVEVFVLGGDWNASSQDEGVLIKAMLRSNKALRQGQRLMLEVATLELERAEGGGVWWLRLRSDENIGVLLQRLGSMPLPPYIRRRRRVLGEEEVRAEDRSRYQTVYARSDLKEMGAVAAPTAGLHFTDGLLMDLEKAGVARGFVTLHVGIGTFKPLGDEGLDRQRLHRESYEISDALVEAVEQTKRDGGRIIAVGTTSARALEDQGRRWGERRVTAGRYATDIFIRPGFEWRLVDGLVTNFHLPKSSLLVLVAALIGYDALMALYREAVSRRFRFYSYGDASMLFRGDRREG